MKPVELEILLQDSLTPGIGKAGKAFGVLSSQAKAAMKMVKAEIRDSKSLIRKTETDIRNLEKAYGKASTHKEELALKAEIEAAKKALLYWLIECFSIYLVFIRSHLLYKNSKIIQHISLFYRFIMVFANVFNSVCQSPNEIGYICRVIPIH